jgi:hypothetical protein
MRNVIAAAENKIHVSMSTNQKKESRRWSIWDKERKPAAGAWENSSVLTLQ